MNSFHPILDRVLCKRVEQDKKEGSIWLPDSASERSQVFRVVAVGPGRPHHKTGKVVPVTVKEGDIVFVQPHLSRGKCGYPVRIGDEEFTVFEFEDEILAVLTGDGPLPVGADEV